MKFKEEVGAHRAIELMREFEKESIQKIDGRFKLHNNIFNIDIYWWQDTATQDYIFRCLFNERSDMNELEVFYIHGNIYEPEELPIFHEKCRYSTRVNPILEVTTDRVATISGFFKYPRYIKCAHCNEKLDAYELLQDETKRLNDE